MKLSANILSQQSTYSYIVHRYKDLPSTHGGLLHADPPAGTDVERRIGAGRGRNLAEPAWKTTTSIGYSIKIFNLLIFG